MSQLSSTARVPVGFRFHPTDEELVAYYLPKKVAAMNIDLDLIRDLDLYKLEPWDLHDLCKVQADTNQKQTDYYFFSRKDKKYPTGNRANRATAAGFWKATGRDKPIHTSKLQQQLIGMRKTLVFYEGRAPHGIKTEWIMHEFRLDDGPGMPAHEDGGWVVCRVFKKTRSFKLKLQETAYCYDQEQMGMLQDMSSPEIIPDMSSPEMLSTTCGGGGGGGGGGTGGAHGEGGSSYVGFPIRSNSLAAAHGTICKQELIDMNNFNNSAAAAAAFNAHHLSHLVHGMNTLDRATSSGPHSIQQTASSSCRFKNNNKYNNNVSQAQGANQQQQQGAVLMTAVSNNNSKCKEAFFTEPYYIEHPLSNVFNEPPRFDDNGNHDSESCFPVYEGLDCLTYDQGTGSKDSMRFPSTSRSGGDQPLGDVTVLLQLKRQNPEMYELWN